MASGIKVFASLKEAEEAGFAFYERTAEGFLVRRDDGHSYALAIVKVDPVLKPEKEPSEA
jgi:hypothetical protein